MTQLKHPMYCQSRTVLTSALPPLSNFVIVIISAFLSHSFLYFLDLLFLAHTPSHFQFSLFRLPLPLSDSLPSVLAPLRRGL